MKYIAYGALYVILSCFKHVIYGKMFRTRILNFVSNFQINISIKITNIWVLGLTGLSQCKAGWKSWHTAGKTKGNVHHTWKMAQNTPLIYHLFQLGMELKLAKCWSLNIHIRFVGFFFKTVCIKKLNCMNWAFHFKSIMFKILQNHKNKKKSQFFANCSSYL